jgi:hypothetical protein
LAALAKEFGGGDEALVRPFALSLRALARRAAAL